MKKIIDDCVGCTSMGLHCLGHACSKRSREIHCCDNCEEEETLYHFEGGEYCIECIMEMLEVVRDV